MTEDLIQARIDLDAIAHNVRELRRVTHVAARLLVAVKAEGYGHGAVPTARTALANGATDLGVARWEEGVALRRAGITAPILIFGYTPETATRHLLDNNLTASVYSADNAARLGQAAVSQAATLPVHVKVDTGMGRLGLLCDPLRTGRRGGAAAEEIAAISRCKGIRVDGVFTHFAASDETDKTYTRLQFSRFEALLADLKSSGLDIALAHAANSGAIIDMPATHLDMVRAGIAVYGLYPSAQVDQTRVALKPAMRLSCTVVHVKAVPAGTKISYGCTFETHRPTVIATIAAGYGDGLNRSLSNRGHAIVHGQRVPVVGRVCMDLTMLDVGDVPGTAVGDEAVLIGCQGNTCIRAEEVAKTLGTINYEVVTSLTSRVRRVYAPVA